MTSTQDRTWTEVLPPLHGTAREAAVLRKAGIFTGLAVDAVDALVAQMEVASRASGSVIFQQGEPGRHLYVILSGTVKLAQVSAHGGERLIALLAAGDQFGELSLLDPGPRTATATVVDSARLASVDKDQLERWMLQRPEIALQMLRVVSRRLRRTRADLADMIFLDVPGRVANLLLDLASRFGVRDGSGIRIRHGLTQVELAQLIGASRETVNKTLSDFTGRGWIRQRGGSVLLLDVARLKRRAGR